MRKSCLKFSQMQNFDVQLNLLLVNKALLLVLTMCLALLQRGETLFFVFNVNFCAE